MNALIHSIDYPSTLVYYDDDISVPASSSWVGDWINVFNVFGDDTDAFNTQCNILSGCIYTAIDDYVISLWVKAQLSWNKVALNDVLLFSFYTGTASRFIPFECKLYAKYSRLMIENADTTHSVNIHLTAVIRAY